MVGTTIIEYYMVGTTRVNKMWTLELGHAQINYFRLIRAQPDKLKPLFFENLTKKDKLSLTKNMLVKDI